MIEAGLRSQLDDFEKYAQEFFKSGFSHGQISGQPSSSSFDRGPKLLIEASQYSFFSGGKRFRPLLVFSAAQAMGLSFKDALPWALAIEMVHTYSLIHDDLPCIDNDDVRRGQPTCHRKFDESIALLAGDLLCTEASAAILNSDQFTDSVKIKLCQHLNYFSGMNGMIAGQTLDLYPNEVLDQDFILRLHAKKTAALFRACIVGTCEIANLSENEVAAWDQWALDFGISFQLKDDILDLGQDKEVHKNLALFLDQEAVQELIDLKSQLCLEKLSSRAVGLRQLVQWNQTRSQ